MHKVLFKSKCPHIMGINISVPLFPILEKVFMWRSVPPVPESGSEVVAAGEEGGMGGRVDHPAHLYEKWGG